MPNNPWGALDPTGSPASRARGLRRIWEDFLRDGRLDQSRPPISESWRRSRATGFDPSTSRAPSVLGDRREAAERWEAHPLAANAPLIRRWLGPVAGESGQLMVVSDADGVLLWEDGDFGVRSAAADTMNFVEGALWSESGGGTNGIGTALATDHAVQVHGAEHLSEAVHGWTCAAGGAARLPGPARDGVGPGAAPHRTRSARQCSAAPRQPRAGAAHRRRESHGGRR